MFFISIQKAMIKKKDQVKIILSAYDVFSLEEAVSMLVQKLLQTKTSFINPIPMPTKRKLISLISSPHRYKYSQEQFERIIHRRVTIINQPTKQDIENLNRLRLPGTVNIR